MVGIPTGLDCGDCRIGKMKYAELKISFKPSNGKYNIKNIRQWQNFDYYILCFVDEYMKDKYYCVNKDVIAKNPELTLSYQNGTVNSNVNNTKVNMSVSIHHDDVNFYFKEHNLLGGTSYKHLLKFIKSCKDEQSVSTIEQHIEASVMRHREKASTISYLYNGKHIKGKNNKDSMFQLVKEIGPKKLEGIIWKSQLGKENKPYHEYIGNGYYFNPKFSLRDTLLTIRMINEKTNFNVQIIK
jgi:hypothetical protein